MNNSAPYRITVKTRRH